ncbi:MAG: aminoacyl-tRNA hydrolase [Candidatus Omnitrophica bacterium]|nr:aminoacyl-tRNA hydrolase [Candidatus Omnitrophota bacterium]
MKLIVGLGNPGRRYSETRHNVGFTVADAIAGSFGKKLHRDLLTRSRLAVIPYGKGEILLAKPLTYMNLSGGAVRRLVLKRGIKVDSDLLVVSDDADLPLGRLRFRSSGSAGGHRGLSSIIEVLGTKCFARLRVGIGRPGSQGATLSDFVLEGFSEDERPDIERALKQAREACLLWVREGSHAVMQRFNA